MLFPFEQLFSTSPSAPMVARASQVSDPTQVINSAGPSPDGSHCSHAYDDSKRQALFFLRPFVAAAWVAAIRNSSRLRPWAS
jgi:hypothetical protein